MDRNALYELAALMQNKARERNLPEGENTAVAVITASLREFADRHGGQTFVSDGKGGFRAESLAEWRQRLPKNVC